MLSVRPAGGSATAARLESPHAIDFDSTGKAYILDAGNAGAGFCTKGNKSTPTSSPDPVDNAVVRTVSTSGIIALLAGKYGNVGFADGALGVGRFGFSASDYSNDIGVSSSGVIFVAVSARKLSASK